ncbi:MAG: NAD-dependent epimerase/dehydratase family protein, partial [Gammaproteobacteria bacterium]
MEKTKILVTGAAGFIGFSLAKQLIKNENFEITGYDNINDYYDPQLKYDRLHQLGIDRSSIRRGELIQSEQYA